MHSCKKNQQTAPAQQLSPP